MFFKTASKVVPKLWIVERTFAWLGHFRRLAKDFEIRVCHCGKHDLYCDAQIEHRQAPVIILIYFQFSFSDLQFEGLIA